MFWIRKTFTFRNLHFDVSFLCENWKKYLCVYIIDTQLSLPCVTWCLAGLMRAYFLKTHFTVRLEDSQPWIWASVSNREVGSWAGLAALLPFRVWGACRTPHLLFASSLCYLPVINNANTVVYIVPTQYLFVSSGLASRYLVSLTVFTLVFVCVCVFIWCCRRTGKQTGFRYLICDSMHPVTLGNLHLMLFCLLMLLYTIFIFWPSLDLTLIVDAVVYILCLGHEQFERGGEVFCYSVQDFHCFHRSVSVNWQPTTSGLGFCLFCFAFVLANVNAEFLDSSSVMKKTRLLTVVVSAVFFVALVSLYRMLDLMQRLELKHERAGLPGHVEEVSRLRSGFPFSCLPGSVVST